MDLFQTCLFRNGGRCVLVERAPMAREVKLLMDIDVLIPENLARRVYQVTQTRNVHHITYIRHRAPRPGGTYWAGAITNDDLTVQKQTHSSSFCTSDSWRKSMPWSSVPMAGVRVMTLEAAESRLFFPGSAAKPLSTTLSSSRGSQETAGKVG